MESSILLALGSDEHPSGENGYDKMRRAKKKFATIVATLFAVIIVSQCFLPNAGCFVLCSTTTGSVRLEFSIDGVSCFSDSEECGSHEDEHASSLFSEQEHRPGSCDDTPVTTQGTVTAHIDNAKRRRFADTPALHLSSQHLHDTQASATASPFSSSRTSYCSISSHSSTVLLL